MSWFYGKPKQEGYYWIKLKNDKVKICYVALEIAGIEFTFCGNDMVSSYQDLKGSQWWGPIKPPEKGDQ